jgi:dipeptidyl aminopeptidase/acylaminoacyl peptidase
MSTRFYLFVCLFIAKCEVGCAQKPPIDTSVYEKWPMALYAGLTPDGNYAYTYIHNDPIKSHKVIFQSLHDSWRVEEINAGSVQFSSDSHWAIFLIGADSLCLVTLGTDHIEYIPHVSSFLLAEVEGQQWIAFQKNSTPTGLVIKSLSTSASRSISNVFWYSFGMTDKVLFLQTDVKDEKKKMLAAFDLATGGIHTIWEGEQANIPVFSSDKKKFAFTGSWIENNVACESAWYYNSDDSVVGIQSLNFGLDKDLWEMTSLLDFSSDGKVLFFKATKKRRQPAQQDPSKVKVDIWSYVDAKLQSVQLKELERLSHPSFTFALSLVDDRSIQLEQDSERIIYPYNLATSSNYLLLWKSNGGDEQSEWYWNFKGLGRVYLISMVDGSKTLIKDSVRSVTVFSLSPDSKFVLYYDPIQRNYICYDISQKAFRNITRGINTLWTTYNRGDEKLATYRPIGIAGWTNSDKVLLYDQSDLYAVDPELKSSPVNLTNGYGRRNNIQFHLAMFPHGSEAKLINLEESILLSAFNRNTKEDGFYRIAKGIYTDPERLTLVPYLLSGTDESDNNSATAPAKARDANVYILRKMSAEDAPNYYTTTNFKKFTALTGLHPQKDYNWLTSELITWKTFDSTISQGILYKPEDFDSTKKYPIIFVYYERLSEDLHVFPYPNLNGATIDIPWYVSNGYLIFLPDIHYKFGNPGKCAFNSVVSAAQFLSKNRWVDNKRMGIQGHSFGGYQTNYIVTHTNLFAAACSASGWADFISAYNGIRELGDARSRQINYDLYRERMGATLWEKPKWYIQSSPIFKADKVSTPLLMMNNKKDGDVSFSQGVEFFTALRRLGKKVWMLQYDDEDHVLTDREAVVDYSIREQQFFDHYLKDKPAAKWMVKGIPAKDKGVDLGYEILNP